MSTNSIEWKTSIFPYKPKMKFDSSPVIDHPLKNVVVTEKMPRRISNSQSSTGCTTPVSSPASILEPLSAALEGLDPLTEFAIHDMDPLSRMAAELDINSPTTKNNSEIGCPREQKSIQISWSTKKASILNKFTTSEKLSIITSFLSGGEKVVVKAQSTLVDKVQHRLEQLDYFEESSQRKLDLSQTEYEGRIELLNKELVTAWHSEQRVKALKIAIQCAKLLADTDVLPFYPSKFVLVTDILDIFGQLVYDRLKSKADYGKHGSKPSSIPEDFTPSMIPEKAKETCLNWFYKIASIRELVPRIYVELALLKSYKFISVNEGPQALLRITRMIHGLGNPLVSAYARCYLCRVGMNTTTTKSDNLYVFNNFTSFLETYPHLFSRSVKVSLKKQQMSQTVYMSLFTPALDFILEAITYNASDQILTNILNRYKLQRNNSLILNTIISAFKPSYVASRTIEFLETIGDCSDNGIPLYVLLRTLGLSLSLYPPPSEQRKQVLSIVWQYLGTFSDTGEYITCVEAWIPYVIKYFSVREINTVLGDIINHIYPNRAYEQHYSQLKSILENTISNINDFESLFIMENFLPLLDMFQQESVRVDLCKSILSSCNIENRTSDPVIINALIFLCTILHDSVNAFTPEDEFRQIGQIMCNVIRKVDYGRDFEQQLSFYVEARSSFSNIDCVLEELVQCVNTLIIKTRDIVQGAHNRKTGDFVRACAAYCFITIPSITSAKTRLKLYLLSGQISLFNQCLGQADACFRAIMTVLSELQDDTSYKNEPFIISYSKQWLSTLLVIPDNPDQGVLSLLRLFLNTLQHLNWDPNQDSLIAIYLSVLDVLSAMVQEDFPYHVDRVESNDTLYGNDPKFISEVDKMLTIITGEILAYMKKLGPSRKQSTIALELFIRILNRGDIRHKPMHVLALNLWQQCTKHGYADVKLMGKIKQYYKRRSETTKNMPMLKIVDKL